jgi:hypothetical protein
VGQPAGGGRDRSVKMSASGRGNSGGVERKHAATPGPWDLFTFAAAVALDSGHRVSVRTVGCPSVDNGPQGGGGALGRGWRGRG